MITGVDHHTTPYACKLKGYSIHLKLLVYNHNTLLTAIDSLLHVISIGWTQFVKSPSEGSVIPVCDNTSSCSILLANNCSTDTIVVSCCLFNHGGGGASGSVGGASAAAEVSPDAGCCCTTLVVSTEQGICI